MIPFRPMGGQMELRTSMVLQVVLAIVLLPVLVGLAVVGPIAVKVIMVLLGAGYIWLIVRLAGRRMWIDERGIRTKGAFGTSELAWDQVSHYTYWSMGQQAVYAGQAGLAGALVVGLVLLIARAVGKGDKNRKFTQGRLTIFGVNGERVHVDRRYKKVTEALDVCFHELHGRLRTRPRNYAPFTLSDTELVHAKKGPIGLADVEKVDCAQARLSVRKRGKRLAWAGVQMKNVNNVMLLVEDLAERGLVVNAQHEVFVPPPVLTKLLEAASRQAALPRAEIRRR